MSKMNQKEKIVLTLADPKRVADLLFRLKFFDKIKIYLKCPNRKTDVLWKTVCEAKGENKRHLQYLGSYMKFW